MDDSRLKEFGRRVERGYRMQKSLQPMPKAQSFDRDRRSVKGPRHGLYPSQGYLEQISCPARRSFWSAQGLERAPTKTKSGFANHRSSQARPIPFNQVTLPNIPNRYRFLNDKRPSEISRNQIRSMQLDQDDLPDRPIRYRQSYKTTAQVTESARPASAPHLKYGLFSKKNQANSLRVQSRYQNVKPLRPQTPVPQEQHIRKDRSKRKGPHSLVFRTQDRRQTRHLSLSEIMHIDIKPEYISPSYQSLKQNSFIKNSSSIRNTSAPYIVPSFYIFDSKSPHLSPKDSANWIKSSVVSRATLKR